MSLKDNKEFIIIIVGVILTITIYGCFVGLPMIVIGAYYLNKKTKNPLKEELQRIQEEINSKQNELDNLEQLRMNEINRKITDKQNELNNLDQRLAEEEIEKRKNIDEKLSEKQEKLDNIEQILNQKEEERTRKVNAKLQANTDKIKETDKKIRQQENQLKRIEQNFNITWSLTDKQKELNKLKHEIREKQKEYDLVQEDILMQEYGLYTPTYNFTTSEEYKEKLKEVRKRQKQLIKDNIAAISTQEWTVNGSITQGQALTKQNIKQAIYSFNIECQQIIDKTKLSNVEKQESKIRKAYDKINKMNERNTVKITPQYLKSKIKELHLAIDYELKKQEEKELLKEARAREKEERKVQKELDKKEKEIERKK